MKAYVCVRSQKSRGAGGANVFGGPDTYVAVQVVPDGQLPLAVLNHKMAKARGILIKYFGEGYHRNQGPRSALGRARAAAEAYAEDINQGDK